MVVALQDIQDFGSEHGQAGTHHHRSAGVAACAPEVEGNGKDVLCSPMQLRSAAERDLDAASTAAVAPGLHRAQVATPKLRFRLAEAPPPVAAGTSSPAVVQVVAAPVPLLDGQGDFAMLGLVMGFWNSASCSLGWEWTSQRRTNSFHSYNSCKGCSCGWGCALPHRDFHDRQCWAGAVVAQVAPEKALPQVPSVHLGESPCDPPAHWDQ